ncbi:WW domain-containing oxidoreductase [Papilio machaon]|uniref:WW domain-containing oxidoreductase n=1 Tax=Papilio machaon TaxID=76193 RepID=UPI001E6635F8|nr:WW domain-containing oxidoreductase [Papilio machaon]
MLFKYISRKVTVISRVHTRHVTNISIWRNDVLENALKFIQRNVEFVRIHGPTADEVTRDVNLTDKTCLITGANSGIGLEVTKCLLARGCKVLMACRNTYAANIAVKNVPCEKANLINIHEVNLTSLASVKNLSDNLQKEYKKIDIVILNAAVFGIPWTLTEDGLETAFQVNYLSQYYLLMNIEKILAPNARVVFTSSESHRNINWNMPKILSPSLEHLSIPKEEYTSIRAYNISKLCSILAMHYLGYRWLNTEKTVFCAHPGSFIKTRLCRNWWVYEALYTTMLPFSKTIRQAASTILYCATSPELSGVSAQYFKDCRRCEESDLASDMHLAFKINDITREILRERAPAFIDTFRVTDKPSASVPNVPTDVDKVQRVKENVEHDSLISSYTN